MVHQPLYTVDLGGLTLAVLDDAVSDETDLDRDVAQIYADEIAGLPSCPRRSGSCITARPGRRRAGPLGIPIGGNLTLDRGQPHRHAQRPPPDPPYCGTDAVGSHSYV